MKKELSFLIAVFLLISAFAEAEDVDDDEEISMVDATLLQHWLAEMSVKYRIGESI